MSKDNAVGIASLGLHLPPLAMPVETLATLRGVDPNKFTQGLGCRAMALCDESYDVVKLGAEAARRALSRWDGDVADIGLVAVGTETAQDMSRPLSAFIAEALELRGRFRSYEVKHACYGGTLALRQALEWKASGASRGKAALVIAADVALYAEKDPGEPTQGAGAVAMVVDGPEIASVDLDSYAFAEPAFDFWRPVGEAYPRVDGPLSLDCYMKATRECFEQLVGDRDPAEALEAFAHLCFHVPFPKMVKKAVVHLGERFGWDDKTVAGVFERQVAPTMRWNQLTGNSYTAALWTSVASVLAGADEGTRLAAFSYGSGYGSELLTLTAGPEAAVGAWKDDFEGDVAKRTEIDAERYTTLRASR